MSADVNELVKVVNISWSGWKHGWWCLVQALSGSRCQRKRRCRSMKNSRDSVVSTWRTIQIIDIGIHTGTLCGTLYQGVVSFTCWH